ncbi:MAG TPA: DUF5724 domain-containing protein [Gemmatimonadales bacterium]
MDQERLKAELEAKHDPGAVMRRLRGLRQLASRLTGGGLPGDLRALIEEAFAVPSYVRPSVVSRRRGDIGAQLQALSLEDWHRAIAVLLPHLAPSVESACGLLSFRPYQEGLTRKPFRSPGSPATLADVRGRWLLNTTLLLGEYDADIRWVAERAAHLAGWYGSADLGWLLAGAIDAGGTTGREVQEILVASALGEHETGMMGRHVTQALMSCSRPDAWEFVEKLLLSAQRQEGLRQAILESVDEAHPQVFRRMLRLILEEDLARFSSVVRAADTWFGFMWDGSSGVKIDTLLRRVLLLLEDPAARAAALDESDAETVYLALWATAFEDVEKAVGPAAARLGSRSPEVRFVAAHFLVQALWTGALPPLLDALTDADLRVAARALDAFGVDQSASVDGERLFSQLERLMGRLTKRSQMLGPLVWPWWTRKLERPQVAAALAANVSAVPGERLLPYVPDLEAGARATFILRAAGFARLGERPTPERRPRALSPAERTVALDLLGDPSEQVRAAAFTAIGGLPVGPDEVDRLVELLGRKPGDLRNGALRRLRTLDDAELLAAADRLLADSSEQRRLAGLELLRDAWESSRGRSGVRERVARYAAGHPSLTDPEQAHVTAVLGEQIATATRDDALGLVDVTRLRRWPEPRARRVVLETPAARASLESLAGLVLAHQAQEVRTSTGEMKLLVEAVTWHFGPRKREDLAAAESLLPLAATWRAWLRERPAELRDGDALELLRVLAPDEGHRAWKGRLVQQLRGASEWSAGMRFLRGLCEWCVAWEPPAGGVDFLLDGLENEMASFSEEDCRELAAQRASTATIIYRYADEKQPAWEPKLHRAEAWLLLLRWWRELFPDSVRPEQAERLYALLRAFESRAAGARALRVRLSEFLGVYRAGLVDQAELLDLMAGRWSFQADTSILREASARKPARELAEHPELVQAVDRCRRRVVEIETRRGDRQTAASGLAMELRWTGGLDTVTRAVAALGKSHFSRTFGWAAAGASRQETLSHLVVRSVPRPEDTPEAFAGWARQARLSEARLVELAVYAPQWAAHVNQVLCWPGLDGAVWWIQAHTKDDRSWRLQEMKELWAAEVSERTPLSAGDLTEGAVDVAWFRQCFGELGAERWRALDQAAKYAASSAGHTRAQLFARAMAGLVTRDDLFQRIDSSRHQDSVRALGLLPLPEGGARRTDLLERYLRLERFRRESRRFGAQRQQSESRAVAIGLANLARTAGYRDPQRLQWAMEQQAVADLARGPVVVTRGDVSLALAVDAEGVPSLDVSRNGTPLKTLPVKLRKDTEVEELKRRLQELKRQRSRVREALEEAMCRGDRFDASELRVLLEHPILAPALSRLVFVAEGGAGYPAEGGRVLRDHAGAPHVLGSDEEVRVAHPHDLLARGDWSAWQRECYRAERVQPFKQVFRELYPITESEREAPRSRRYAGHQVNPRQALALLGGRGWVARPEEGVGRTFHAEGLTARLGFQEAFYTPADIEGLTLEDVVFTRKGEWGELPLAEIPPRVFSETMRDLDLVVSVAHRGGVDPEATASTVEMRSALVRETCQLLGLDNVRILNHHALVQGDLGQYSVHLGSAGVMLLPGTALPIVAVHSQHRGRLFLPFADDDPRTAEVLSKVLLLARDRDIRDPNILEWIRAGQGGGTN